LQWVYNKKGFTLIELLVVIAIIGILASIVLVSFPTASKKAKDSRVVSAVSQTRTVMVSANVNDGNYDAFSSTHTDITTLWTEITNNARVTGMSGYVSGPLITKNAASNSSAACIFAQLNQKDSYWFCADSTGKAGFTATNPAGAGYCVANTSAVCPTISE